LTGGTPIASLLGPGLLVDEETLRAVVTGATNLGDGDGLFAAIDDGTLGFRSLEGGNNVSLNQRDDELVIEANDSDTNNDGTNLGSGTGLYNGRDGSTLEFRSLVGGTNVTLSTSNGEVTVDASGSGEANTASNVGTGSEWFKQKSGTDLEFRTLTTQGALTATQNTDTVAIGGPWANGDGDDLLEPRSGTSYKGIDLSGVTGAQVVTPWVGTSTATTLEAYVNGTVAASFGTEGTDGSSNTSAGNVLLGQHAQVNDGAVGVAVGGGGSPDNSDENVVADNYGTVGGGLNNQAGSADGTSNAIYATVAGGANNTAIVEGATVGGGKLNDAIGNSQSTVGGGYNNVADGYRATVAGGNGNRAEGAEAAVGGGLTNKVYESYSTIAGGASNTIGSDNNNPDDAKHAMIPGGEQNEVTAHYGFAAGRKATANDRGAFVWGDSTTNSVSSDAADQVVLQAGGGMKVYSASDTSTNTGAELPAGSGSWTSLSTKTAKSDVQPVDGMDTLAAVESLDVATWRYDAEDEDVSHMGPMAEDFYDTFGLGHDERRISNIDADGVALAAIQGAAERIDELEGALDREAERIDDLETALSSKTDRVETLLAALADRDDRIENLEAELESKDERIDRLEDRLAEIERSLDATDQSE
jgi:hypothetical protein